MARSQIKSGAKYCSVLHAAILLCLALFLLPVRLHAAGAASSAPRSQPGNVPDPVLVQGYFSGKYVARKTRLGEETVRDEDVFTDLRLDLSKPLTNSYEFHFFGTLRDDESHHRNRRDFSPFEDIGDTYQSRTHGYLYEAHLDLNNPVSHVTQVRLGRQDGTRDEPVFFDGAAADISITPRVAITAYGGAAVHLYEFDDRWGSDSLQGIGLDILPASSTLVSADFLHTDDKRSVFGTNSRHDQLASLRLSQRFSPNLRVAAKGRYVNGDPRDASLRVVGTAPAMGLELNASYLRQFRVQNELSNELSPYYDVIGQSFPYQSYDVKARKLFGARVAIDVGYFERSLLRVEQENAFNRAFKRSYAVLNVNDLIFTGFSLSLTGEQWKSGNRNSVSTGGVDAGYAFGKGRRSAKVNAGSYYSLYKYDYYFSLGERTRVRTYYAKLDVPFWQHYSLSGAYEFEHGLLDYQTLKLGLRYDF
jgi:hypothetical protein